MNQTTKETKTPKATKAPKTTKTTKATKSTKETKSTKTTKLTKETRSTKKTESNVLKRIYGDAIDEEMAEILNSIDDVLEMEIPSRSALKSHEMCYLMKKSLISKEGLFWAIVEAYNLGYKRGYTRAKNQKKKGAK